MELKGDFIGFWYNGHHSSEFNIARNSNSDRYEHNLIPSYKDDAVSIPGGDGTYYFGSQYTQREFNIDFSFDDMSELQFRKLKTLFADKKMHELVFDEHPYKVYRAKPLDDLSLSYICFNKHESFEYNDKPASGIATDKKVTALYSFSILNIDDETVFTSDNKYYSESDAEAAAQEWIEEHETETDIYTYNTDETPINQYIYSPMNVDAGGRVYKGEGSITLVAYDPFGYCYDQYRYLGCYDLDDDNKPAWYSVDNVAEWGESSGLPQNQLPSTDMTLISFQNPGDMEADFIVTLDAEDNFTPDTEMKLTIYGNTADSTAVLLDQIRFQGFSLRGNDNAFAINSRTQLIEGLIKTDNIYRRTGNIYNNTIDIGHFFKLPITDKYPLYTIELTQESTQRFFSIAYNIRYI